MNFYSASLDPFFDIPPIKFDDVLDKGLTYFEYKDYTSAQRTIRIHKFVELTRLGLPSEIAKHILELAGSPPLKPRYHGFV